MMLDCPAGPGLRMALETPDRIDPLFVERAAQPVAERLQVLASEEKLTEPLHYAPGAARRLIDVANDRDGSDNISVVLIRVRDVERVGMYRGRPYKLR